MRLCAAAQLVMRGWDEEYRWCGGWKQRWVRGLNAYMGHFSTFHSLVAHCNRSYSALECHVLTGNIFLCAIHASCILA